MVLGSSAPLGIRGRWWIGLSLSCSLSVAGAQSRKLSGELAHGGLAPEPFALTPDGARVVYLGTHASEFHFDVFSAPADGTGEPVRLSARFEYPERSGDAPSIGRFWIVPDGNEYGRVAFAADHVFREHYNYLFVVPADGSAPQQLVASSYQAITAARFTPDGQRVVYLATGGFNQPFELYSAPLDGSAPPTRLGGPPAPELGNVHDFQLSADGAMVVSTLDEGVPGCEFCEPTEALVLLAVPVDGSAAPIPLARLRAKLQHLGRPPRDVPFPDFLGERIKGYVLAPDGSRVLFTTEAPFGDCPGTGCRGESALWSVPLAGGELATRIFAGRALEAVIAADSSRAVFLAEIEATGQLELQAVPLDGSQPARRLHGALPAGATVFEFALAPDAARVAFRADLDGSGEVRLFEVALEGNMPRALSRRLVPGGAVTDFRITADAAWVVYRADLEQDERFGLYAAPLPARPLARRTAGPAPAHGGRLTSGVDEYGSAEPLKLTPVGSRDVSSARFSADSGTVAFVAYLPSTNVSELYAAPLGVVPSAALVTLTPGDGFGYFELTPDGNRMAYTAGRVQQRFDLFGVPRDGSAPPVRLNLPGGGDRDVELTPRPRLSQDGSRVVFVGDPTFSNHDELFSAPIDGSAPAVRLHPPMAESSKVETFELVPGANEAVYLADTESG
jgi:dipeptidyl aminopeptidase/acylaminoacyl peptidase